ncbi:LTR copia-type gag-polypeptide [Tanacetum coccineum]|uniref:LTR copia-type gag-polypeptide n=1 Tax=Tanacetum coccineum TaxID=301880 RepID=A0ABQ5GM50_9ASTR
MAEQDIPPPTITAMKIPIIRKGEYDIWSMRMRQYICHTDHNLWDVIVNGDLEEEPAPTGETSAPPAPKTAKQLAAKRNQERVKSILLLAIPDEYLLKFHNVADAKSLWEAIKSRFGAYPNEVNDIRAERIAKSANPLALLAVAQPYSDNYYQAPKPQRTNTTSSSTRPSASTRHKGKEMAKSVTPQSEHYPDEDSDPEQAQRGYRICKRILHCLAKYFKKLLQTYQQQPYELLQTLGTRLKIRTLRVVQQNGIQCFNCKGFEHYAKECRKPKRVKDYTYHKEKMMMCKQAEQVDQDATIVDDEESKPGRTASLTQELGKVQTNLMRLVALGEATSFLNQKHDELVKKSLLTKSQLEGYLKEKTKVISDLKVKEEKDIDKMIEMDKQLKFLNEIVLLLKIINFRPHMLAPKCSTYNGRPTFANPRYLKKAQSDKPCLYEIPYDTSDLANRFSPDREETMTLANE